MRTVTITVGTGAQGVTIGRRAENEATAVIFDVSALIETYGDGGAVLMVKRPTDADAYPATVERSGASVTWTPTETDLAYKGMGEAELFWYVDGMLAKTAVYTINIRRDIGETTGEAPAPYDDWIATLTELGGQTAENAQRAEVARAAAETAAATATSAANTANTAAERAESAANNAEQDAASTAADRTAAEDAAARAATSATAAAISASAAETSAGQAGVSATSAAASATSAAQSASDAQSAVASIGDSVTRAEAAATTAQSAAQTASAKAAEANTSAGVAASNATTATVKAQEAAQSATQAAQSATAAQAAQTAAEAAQTAAETAQTAAESAEASAEEQADRAEGYANRLTDFLPVDTASGSIASFPDGADGVEVKTATVQIVPKQAGTGDPSPDNVRPITGWDAVTVYGAGVNLLNPSVYVQRSGYNNLSVNASGNVLTITGYTAGGRFACFNVPTKVGQTYTVKLSSYSNVTFAFLHESETEPTVWDGWGPELHQNTAYTYTATQPWAQVCVECSADNATVNDLQFEVGSTATTWAAYSGTTYPITFPTEAGTVYGGVLTYEGDGVWTVESRPYYASYAGETLVGPWVSSMDAYTPGGTPTTGAQVVDLGGTVTEYTLTTEQVVNTLLGQNNFWADCGDTSVTYRADIQLYIQKMIAAALNA